MVPHRKSILRNVSNNDLGQTFCAVQFYYISAPGRVRGLKLFSTILKTRYCTAAVGFSTLRTHTTVAVKCLLSRPKRQSRSQVTQQDNISVYRVAIHVCIQLFFLSKFSINTLYLCINLKLISLNTRWFSVLN